MTLKSLIVLGCLSALSSHAALNVDKKDSINGVNLSSGKEKSVRIYTGSITKSFAFSIEHVKNGVINFTEKCNNSYKDKRKFTDKNVDCKYHNDNLVESFVVKDLNQSGWSKEPNEVERYLIGRQIYNRGSFGYYELIQVFETKNEANKKTIKITQRMLDDNEVKIYTTPKFQKDSAFDKSTGTFVLNELGDKETSLEYEYSAETDHWILNKEISVPQVFSSISKSLNDLMKTVDAESQLQSRDVASY